MDSDDDTSAASSVPTVLSPQLFTVLFARLRLLHIAANRSEIKKPNQCRYKAVLTWAIHVADEKLNGVRRGPISLCESVPSTTLDFVCKFFRVLVDAATSSLPRPPSDTRSAAEYTLAAVSSDSLRPMLTQTFNYSTHLVHFTTISLHLDERPWNFFECMLSQFGTQYLYDNEVLCYTMSSSKMSMRGYLDKYFFRDTLPIPRSGDRKHLSSFLVLAKIAADAQRLRNWTSETPFRRSRKGRPQRRTKLPQPKTYSRTCVSVEVIVNAYDKLANKLGFRSADIMLQPFIYLHKTTAQLRAVDDSMDGRVVPSEFSFKLYEWDSVTADDAEAESLSDRMSQSTEATEPPLLFGVPRGSQLSAQIFRNLRTSADTALRKIARDFVHDISTDAIAPSVLQADSPGDVFHAEVLEKFTLVNEFGLPPRFDYSLRTINELIAAVNVSRIAGLDSADEEFHESAFPVSEESRARTEAARSEDPVQLHSCAEGCDCADLRDDVNECLFRYSIIDECDFRRFIQVTLRDPGLTPISGRVQFILTDPPSQLKTTHGRKDGEHDVLYMEDVDTVVDHSTRLLRPGGHIVLFCTIQNYQTWATAFRHKVDPSMNTPAFSVSNNPLVFIPASGTYEIAPFGRNLTHHNLVLFACHAVRRLPSSSASSGIDMVQWQNCGSVYASHPAQFNVVDNVPPFQAAELLHTEEQDDVDGPVRKKMRPDQHCVRLCMELVQRYSMPGDIVVDFFGGTFTTAVACLSLPAVRKFVGSDCNTQCVRKGKERVFYAFLHTLVMRKDLPEGLVVRDDVMEKAKTLVERAQFSIFPHGGISYSSVDANLDRSALPYAQRLPEALLYFIANSKNDERFLQTSVVETPPSSWSPDLFDMLNFLSVDALRNNLLSKFSLFRTPDRPRFQIVAAKAFARHELIGTLFGTILYDGGLNKPSNSRSTYGHGVFRVTASDFSSFAVPAIPRDKALSIDDVQYSKVFVVPAPFCPFRDCIVAQDSVITPVNAVCRLTRSKRALSLAQLTNPSYIQVFATKQIAKYEVVRLLRNPDNYN